MAGKANRSPFDVAMWSELSIDVHVQHVLMMPDVSMCHECVWVCVRVCRCVCVIGCTVVLSQLCEKFDTSSINSKLWRMDRLQSA